MRTLRSELIRIGLLQACTGVEEQKVIKVKDNAEELLSAWELRELMGVNRPTYGRKKGGAYRQR